MKRAFSLFEILIVIASTAIICSTATDPRPLSEASFSPSAAAQVLEERGIVALDQSLRELNNPFTLMCVAAHPEDPDYGTLAYYRKSLGARTVIVVATRGESGQHSPLTEPSTDLGEAGTRKAIGAARIVGAEAYFLNLADFGYSKSAEEALRVWGYEKALQRLVRAIRLLRPDVIITNHDSGSGNGHHQAIGRLVVESFNISGDAKRFPEANSEPWQASRLFLKSGPISFDVKVDLSAYDHLRGLTYAHMAGEAFKQSASEAQRVHPNLMLEQEVYYKLLRSAADDKVKPSASLIEGLILPGKLLRSITPPRVGDLAAVDAINQRESLVEALIERLIEKRAEGTPKDLHERYGSQFFRVIRFTDALERAIALALGLSFEIRVVDNVVVPGQKLIARYTFRNGSRQLLPVIFHTPESLPAVNQKTAYKSSEVMTVPGGAGATKEIEHETAKTASVTLPHSAHLYDEDYYPMASALPGALTDEPLGHNLFAVAEVGLGQTAISLPALTRFDVAPQVEISTLPFVILRDWDKPREIEVAVRVRNRTPGELKGELWVVPLALATDDYEPMRMSFAREDEEVSIKLRLKLPILKPPLAPDVLIEFRLEKPAPPNALGFAKIAVTSAGFELAEGLRVGYVSNSKSWLGLALTELGAQHGELSIDDIRAGEQASAAEDRNRPRRVCNELTRFDVIVIDERAYYELPELISANRCLFDYASHGGHLVVLYQLPDDWSALGWRWQKFPFSINLSNDRITVERSPVKILDPNHVLMSKPNKITAQDFEGWVVERAAYLPKEWSSQYTPLLETGDPGEEPKQGSLLVARLGEGSFIYTSFAWSRQLLTMNKGAYRVFANLLSFPKTNKESSTKG